MRICKCCGGKVVTILVDDEYWSVCTDCKAIESDEYESEEYL